MECKAFQCLHSSVLWNPYATTNLFPKVDISPRVMLINSVWMEISRYSNVDLILKRLKINYIIWNIIRTVSLQKNSQPTETAVSSCIPSYSRKIKRVYRDKETMYLKLSRERDLCFVYSYCGQRRDPAPPSLLHRNEYRTENKQLWTFHRPFA